MAIQRLDTEYMQKWKSESVPKMEFTQNDGTVLVPPEFIQKRIDLIREAARWNYASTKPEWIKALKKECERSSNGELLLVPLDMDEWKNMCRKIIKEVVEKPELTKEAMAWTRDAIIAQFMDETGLSEEPRINSEGGPLSVRHRVNGSSSGISTPNTRLLKCFVNQHYGWNDNL